MSIDPFDSESLLPTVCSASTIVPTDAWTAVEDENPSEYRVNVFERLVCSDGSGGLTVLARRARDNGNGTTTVTVTCIHNDPED